MMDAAQKDPLKGEHTEMEYDYEMPEAEDGKYDDQAGEMMSAEKKSRHAITGRGVTLKMLMVDGVIHAGESLLTLDYMGQKFTADLLPNGRIKSNEFDQTFPSPSSWAMYCKKLVNPAKPSGCGWSSVKYKGRKLDSWKATWLRQMNTASPESHDVLASGSDVNADPKTEITPQHRLATPTPTLPDISPPSRLSKPLPPADIGCPSEKFIPNEPVFDDDDGSCILDLTKKPLNVQEKKADEIPQRKQDTEPMFMEEQEEALNLSMKDNSSKTKTVGSNSTKPPQTTPTKSQAPPPQSIKKEIQSEPMDSSTRHGKGPIRHASLPYRNVLIDQNQLVECETFSNLGKAQPYTVSMSTNSLLLLDFHCHLTTSEVVGYLGGKWDQTTQHLSIQQCFPCRCRLGDTQSAAIVEDQIRATMKHLGMSLVGWYHSHPYSPAEPSVKDIECQMMYQLKMKVAKSTYYPCVGIINSPYDAKSMKTESSVRMYMVMPPPEKVKTDYGVPMSLKYSTKQNHSISEDLLNEMRLLCEFYNRAPDWISFKHSWHPGITYLEKLTTSLNDKLPEDQLDNGTFLEFVQHVLAMSS